MDYAVEKCLDDDQNVRCTKPFLVSKDTCYKLEWSTKGVLSHTTVEVRDAGSGEIVFYRDTNGEWEPEKGEVGSSYFGTPKNIFLTIAQLVYMDFKPKVWKQGNETVEYTVSTCDK